MVERDCLHFYCQLERTHLNIDDCVGDQLGPDFSK